MGLGGSSSSQTIGFAYEMSLHLGLGRGPIDQIVEIDVGDKMAWPIPGGTVPDNGPHPSDSAFDTAPPVPGDPGGLGSFEGGYTTENVSYVPLTSNVQTRIDAPELFGGEKKEGGIQGRLWVMMGAATQVIPNIIKGLLGGDVPEFRGVATVFFDGLVCAMNPYPKVWKFRVRRALMGWDGPVWQPSLAVISYRDGAVKAYNPAHIIYECATNRDWGRGFDRALIDEDSFLKAATQLYNENFGLCLRYNRTDDLGEFVGIVINHIAAVLYTSRETGLLSLKLIRDDYDVNTLPLFTPSTGLLDLSDPEDVAREDLVNEVIVKYKDPVQNRERSVRAHNLASIQTQNGVKKSSTVEYPGVPEGGLAARLCTRDLRVASTSGSRYKVRLDRSAWRMVPADVFRVSDPSKGVVNLVLRAGDVDQDDIEKGEIRVTAVPDIFGLPAASFSGNQDPVWTRPDTRPRNIVNSFVREATYRDLVMLLSRADLAQVTASEAYVLASAGAPDTNSFNFIVFTKTSVDTDYRARDTDTFSPVVKLVGAISAMATSANFALVSSGSAFTMPCAAQIEDEIVRIDAMTYNADGVTGVMTIARGCVDTAPAVHGNNTVAFISDTHLAYDRTEYAPGEIISVKPSAQTSSGTFPIEQITAKTITLVGRQGLPYPAANVLVNDVSIYSATPKKPDVKLTWSHRNRIIQQDRLLGYAEASLAREDGVTYTVTVLKGATQLRQATGLTTNTYTYTAAMGTTDGIAATDSITFVLETVRGGLKAFTSATKTVTRG